MRTKKSITGYLFISPFIIGFLLFLLSPVITSFAMSLSDVTLKTDGTGFGLDFWGLKSYIHALTIDKDFNRLLVETVRDLMIDVPCIIIFSLIIAVLLNRSFPGRGVVRAIFFMPVILTSGVIVGMERSNSLLMGIQDMQSAAVDTSITTTVQNLLLGAMGSSGQEIINLVVNIVPGNTHEVYDRLGLEDQYTEILGVKVPMNTIPVTPGRNLAVILEVAAMNNRQRKMGYNAALEFTEQINRHFLEVSRQDN